MLRLSAGILVYRYTHRAVEVFLVHPGGPFWAKKDEGSWSLPKGEYLEGEDVWGAAKREFQEETGQVPPEGKPVPLGNVMYGTKKVTAWALEGNVDAQRIISNVFDLEWPPKSGLIQQFPEVDCAGWFELDVAQQKLVKGQVAFVARLGEALKK